MVLFLTMLLVVTYYNESSKRRAVVPKHNRDLPKGTLLSLLREAGFTREELIEYLQGN